tara:strand:+ start:295 stop:567 length:273 start_codon:yes stop_codon:yes gene_type:complete
MKKGQLSINTVIIAVIAITVLVGIVLFFTTKFGGASSDIDELSQTGTADVTKCQLACNLAKSGICASWDDISEECDITCENDCPAPEPEF